MSFKYSPGELLAFARPELTVVIQREVTAELAVSLWQKLVALNPANGLIGVLDVLTKNLAKDWSELPPFAIVLQKPVSDSESELTVAVRGKLEVFIGDGEVSSGKGVATWIEKSVLANNGTQVIVAGPGKGQKPPLLPISQGVLWVSEVSWDSGPVISENADAVSLPVATPLVAVPDHEVSATEYEVHEYNSEPFDAAKFDAEHFDPVKLGLTESSEQSASEGSELSEVEETTNSPVQIGAHSAPISAVEIGKNATIADIGATIMSLPPEWESSAVKNVSTPEGAAAVHPVPAPPVPAGSVSAVSGAQVSGLSEETYIPEQDQTLHFPVTGQVSANVGEDNFHPAYSSVPTKSVGPGSDAPSMYAPPASLKLPKINAKQCTFGHVNPPERNLCIQCGGRVDGPETQITRPVLGHMKISDGSTIELLKPLIIGRYPSAAKSSGEDARLVTVRSPNHDISRSHLEVRLEGWKVLVTDLGTVNGSVLVRESKAPQQLAPHEPIPVISGDLVDLGDGVTLTFEGIA